jgi:hypothetical protein
MPSPFYLFVSGACASQISVVSKEAVRNGVSIIPQCPEVSDLRVSRMRTRPDELVEHVRKNLGIIKITS